MSYRLDPAAQSVLLPAVLAVAGSDSSGGAGIEADVKTCSMHNVYALTCVTALTAQNTRGVEAVEPTPRAHLDRILRLNFEDFYEGYAVPPLKVMKTGMLTLNAAKAIEPYIDKVKVVMDPVMVSTLGRSLTDEETMHYCMDKIIPKAYLCTPNFDEAVAMYGSKPETDLESFKAFSENLYKKLGCANLLVKGGHIPFGDTVVDVLVQLTGISTFLTTRVDTENTHGTGCTLASAISANLANGIPLLQAVSRAIEYVHVAMTSLSNKLGHGHGPLAHCVAVSHQDVGHKTNVPNLFEYLRGHPDVAPNWKRYTEHPFVLRLAKGLLPFDGFLYYLKQDYYYLVNYAQVHGLAMAVAPDCAQISAQAKIVDSIMNEIERHKARLKKDYGFEYTSFVPGPACVAYCNYLLSVCRKEDFLGIKVALAPCLHGYAEAGAFGKAQMETQRKEYVLWLGDYTSEWYLEADKEGKKTLGGGAFTAYRLAQLVKTFNDVVLLEIAFWDEVLTLDY